MKKRIYNSAYTFSDKYCRICGSPLKEKHFDYDYNSVTGEKTDNVTIRCSNFWCFLG